MPTGPSGPSSDPSDPPRPERAPEPDQRRKPERAGQPFGDGPSFRDRERPQEARRRERLPAAVVVDRPQYTWQDFELQDQPRAQPNRPDIPARGDGLTHCGELENILHRQWDARMGPPSAETIRAVESLARLPDRLKEKLAAGLEGIYVGPGGVPDLDDMGYLRGAPCPREGPPGTSAPAPTVTARSSWGTGPRPPPT